MGQERDRALVSKPRVLEASPPHPRGSSTRQETGRREGSCRCQGVGGRVCGHRGWQDLSLPSLEFSPGRGRSTLLGVENNPWHLAPEAVWFLTIHHYYPPYLTLAWCRGETEVDRQAGRQGLWLNSESDSSSGRFQLLLSLAYTVLKL